jgi:hypothetical protein
MEEVKVPNAPVEKKPIIQELPNDKSHADVYTECINVLASLRRHSNSSIFFVPNPRIKAPRLSDVEQSLKLGKYQTTEDFIKAIRDVWKAFWAQSESESTAYMATTDLSKAFEDFVPKLPYGIIKVPQEENTSLPVQENKKHLHNTPVKEELKAQPIVKQTTTNTQVRTQGNKSASNINLNISIKTSPNKSPNTTIYIPIEAPTLHPKSNIPKPQNINSTKVSIKTEGIDLLKSSNSKSPVTPLLKPPPSSLNKSPNIHGDSANGSVKKAQNVNQPSVGVTNPMKIEAKEKISEVKREASETPPLSTVVSIRTHNPTAMESKSEATSDNKSKPIKSSMVSVAKKVAQEKPLVSQPKVISKTEPERVVEEVKKLDEMKIPKKRPEPEIDLSYTESGITGS